MKINYSKSAIADLISLPKEAQKRIAQKMRFYAKVQNPIRFAERLTDYKDADFRFRIGEYRVLFDVINNSIFILKIKNRKDSYR
jgi:mRNA interferase RelE/StbE